MLPREEWVMGCHGSRFLPRPQDLARIFGAFLRVLAESEITSQDNYLGSSKACLPLIVTRCYKSNFEFFDISR